MAEADTDILALTAGIVSSYLGAETHRMAPEQIPDLIRSVRAALKENEESQSASSREFVVKPTRREIARSIKPDALISFINGKPYKTLKRHLSGHGLTAEGYRERFELPSDYPTVAPAYSASRSAMAKSLGLGARRKESAPPEASKAAAAPRARKARAKA